MTGELWTWASRGLLVAVVVALAAIRPGGSETALAANITVNSTADNLTAGDGNCTLREAISNANSNSDTTGGDCTAGSGADTIDVPAGTYTLTIAGANEDANATGDLDITDETDDLTINGAGQATTIIDGGALDRVFHIVAGTVNISDVTIQNGFALGGGGIANLGTLTLNNSTVAGNTSTGPGVGGGGIDNSGTVTLTSSTVSSNAAFNGGGIDNSGTVTLTNSTVSGNSAVFGGGGIVNFSLGTVTLTNSTVSGNSAVFAGGGIANLGTVTLTSSTVSGNSAGGFGGGIANLGMLTVKNIIVANSPSGGDCGGAGITSLGHNLDSDGTCALGGTGDLSSTNPLLGPLQDNGGPTFTHALLASSPAIDAGDNISCPATDQRGVARPLDGDGDSTATCDIGAYEFEPPIGPTCNGIPATIVGTEGDDKIKGTPGDDAIVGLGGNDRIDGGGGNDCIDGGEGDDRLKGGAGNDTIFGGEGDDRLDGGDGDDDIDGGDGFDRLDGAAGTDTCVNGPLFKNCELP